MNKEQLIAAGVPENVVDQVLALHKESIDGNYIPKVTFEAERTKVKELDQQVKDRDKQLSDLGKFKGTAEELDAQVKKLEKANTEAQEEYNNKMVELEQNFAMKSEISPRVHDADDVLDKIDKSKVVFKDGKVVAGLTEQLAELQKSKPHYFKAEKQDRGNGGFNFFGSTPPEGQRAEDITDVSAATNKSAEFGKQLAQYRTGGSNKNAENAYFN